MPADGDHISRHDTKIVVCLCTSVNGYSPFGEDAFGLVTADAVKAFHNEIEQSHFLAGGESG